jgi:CheY-like chemotaxis protein
LSARDPVAAVINTSPDTVDMLGTVLRQAGFAVVSAYTHEIRDGDIDVHAFLAEHQPDVVVYDIAPPYNENWALFQRLTATSALGGIPVVLTTTNRKHLEGLAGSSQHVYEVVGKPYDLLLIVQATKEALRSRPTR